MGISIKPSKAFAGSAVPEGEHTLVSARFVEKVWEGSGDTTPVLKLELEPADGGDTREQYLGCGKLADLQPSDDELTLDAVSDVAQRRGGMSEGCNAMIFLKSLVEAGFEEDSLDDEDISCLDGLVFISEAYSIERKFGNETKKMSTMVCAEVVTMPGDDEDEDEAPAKKTKGKGKKAKAAPAKAKGKGKGKKKGPSAEEQAETIIVELIEAADKPIRKTKIVTAVFSAVDEDNADREAIIDLASDDDFLEDEDRPWSIEKGKLVIEEEEE